ncbi:MAG: hypothetical protein AB1500_12980 [Bacillota bacterium]
MKSPNDPFTLWVASGIIAVLVRDTYSFLAKQIGFAKIYIWNVGASLLVDVPDIGTFWGTVLGVIVDLSVAGVFGVIMGLLLEWRGRNSYVLKGWGVGITAWLFFYGILYHNLPHTIAYAPSDPLSNISTFIGHSIFGITMAVVYVDYFYKKYIGVNEKNTDMKNGPVNAPDPQVVVLEVENRGPSLWKRATEKCVKTIKPKKIKP